MKKLFTFILLVSLFAGCDNNLVQVNPTGPTGEDFFQTERDVQLAVVAAYAGLTNNNRIWGHNMWGFEAMSDNGYGIADAPYRSWDSFDFDPNNGLISNFYGGLYQAINRANLVIERAPRIEGIAAGDLDNYLGQAHFLRGYEYFLLTLMFEDVPIVLESSSNPAGFSVEASPALDIYNLVISELQMAEQLLPATADQAGRVINTTATALLAKVYLFGADELGISEWYGMAEQKAQEVISSGKYALVDDPDLSAEEDLKMLWSLDGQNSSEDIFAVQHYSSGGWNNGNVASQYPMAINPRLSRDLNIWGFGWMHHYESVGTQWDDADPRKRFSIFFDGDPVVTINGDTLGNYSSATARSDSRPDSGGPKKFWWSESFDRVSGTSDLDSKVLRYADLLLIHAEADLLADGSLSAAGEESFNKVRSRSDLPALDAAAISREVILEERRWELFLECHRWFDLMRTRTAETAFAAITALDTDGNDLEKAGFIADKHYKMPYPQAALDRNPALVQKPTWSGG